MKKKGVSREIQELFDSNMYMLGDGNVAVGYGNLVHMGVLTFQELKKKQKLNSSITDKASLINGTLTTVMFKNVSDVERMIERLTVIKTRMIKNSGVKNEKRKVQKNSSK